MKFSYEKLQNGSDIRGVASDMLGNEINLDDTAITRLSTAFIYLLTVKTGKRASELKISVGRDSRLTGKHFLDVSISAITATGASVINAGLASTPAIFMSTVFPDFLCDGGIMLTASHMPADRNGMKFFTRSGGLDKGDITDIIAFAESNSILSRVSSHSDFNESEKKDNTFNSEKNLPKSSLMERYCKHLREIISVGDPNFLSNMKISIDAGNGAGGFFAKDVLTPLGCDISSSAFLEPDGTFPNHIPNPENKEAMEYACKLVYDSGADLGIVFDTDVDRASAVDEHGKKISGNSIVALAASLISDSCKGSTVVTDSITSDSLTAFIENALGMKHLRYKRGYKNVINKAVELCDSGIESDLAIETSGHAAYRENYFLDDGAYLAAKIIRRATLLKKDSKGISSLIEGFSEASEAEEFRLRVMSPADVNDVYHSIISNLKASARDSSEIEIVEPNYEGLRLSFVNHTYLPEKPYGWCLLRKSLHEPLLPVNIESNLQGGVSRIINLLLPIIDMTPEVDSKPMLSFSNP